MDIQMDMGHSNSTTTQGYINSLRISSMRQSREIKENQHGGIIMTENSFISERCM